MSHAELTTRQHVRNVFFIISSAVLCAFALVGGMIYYYGPSGTYTLDKVLLTPSVLKGLVYNDIDPATGISARYKFDHIDFSEANSQTGRWQRSIVDMESYGRFFAIVSGDRSVDDPRQVEQLFERSKVATLALRVQLHSKSTSSGQRVFQEVQFIDQGDHYRVEVHDDAQELHWAYFKHTGIYEAVRPIFGGE